MVFLPFLLLKYHKADASPFDDNNIIILAIFIAILTYVVAMVTEFKLREVGCPKFISHISPLSAALASVLLSYQEVFQLLRNAATSTSDIEDSMV